MQSSTRRTQRLTAIAAAPLALALVGTVPVAPVQAARAASATSVVIATDGGRATFGERINIRAEVHDAAGAEVRTGSIKLQAKPVDGTWKTIRTVDAGATASGAFDFTSIKPKRNTDYRVKYAGVRGTYKKSTSARARVTVARKVTSRQVGALTFRFRFSPDYANRTVKVSWAKKGTKFKAFRTLRTNAKGQARLTVPAGKARGTYKVRSLKDRHFDGTYAVIRWS